jgi:hypothetical protein
VGVEEEVEKDTVCAGGVVGEEVEGEEVEKDTVCAGGVVGVEVEKYTV